VNVKVLIKHRVSSNLVFRVLRSQNAAEQSSLRFIWIRNAPMSDFPTFISSPELTFVAGLFVEPFRDFDLVLQRARSGVSRLEEEPHLNSNTRTKEFSLRDPDGYYVTISALSGS
jgi:hypothetical protein